MAKPKISTAEATKAAEALVAAAQATEPTATELAVDKQKRTQAYLDAQPKVTILLEKRDGDIAEEYVNINGCKYFVKKGEEVTLPVDVARMIRDKQAAEGRLVTRSETDVKRLGQM